MVAMRIHSLRFLAGCVGMISLGLATPARAVKVNATYNASGPYTNVMSLLPKVTIFDPGTPVFTGLPTLPAPPLLGTNTDSYPAFTFGTPFTAVQMTGDALSSISQPSAGAYDINLTLTNFSISSLSLPANEYVYLNLWETFTGLPALSTATWVGSASVTGTACRTSPLDGLFIEPIATVLDPGPNVWIPASTFFGGTPMCGPLSASAAVNPLTPYISGGNLLVGFEVILGLANNDVTGVDSIVLPTSLELNLHYEPVPAPLPLAGSAVAWTFSRRLRRRIRRAASDLR